MKKGGSCEKRAVASGLALQLCASVVYGASQAADVVARDVPGSEKNIGKSTTTAWLEKVHRSSRTPVCVFVYVCARGAEMVMSGCVW